MKGHGSDIKNKSVSKWYEEFPKAEVPYKHAKTDFEVLNLKEEGKKYLNADTSAFQLKQSHSRNSEIMWLKTALTRGTTSDKVAAAVVLIQDNPKYNLVQLISLISQVKAAKHNQCNMIITALKDLFLSDLLHPKYKLLKFEEQDLDKIDNLQTSDQINKIDGSRKKLLAHWFFEDQLREQYENFVLSLANIASDTVETNREKAISVMTDLLIGNAEQEHKLLELIVNKIGDPHCKVGSKAVFCLKKLLYEHSNMKFVVLKEVEKLLFRKNVGQRAQYYAICLLTQFVLKTADDEIATSLIEVYFAFFKACLKKGEPDSRMMAAILTGVSRAYHFAKMDSVLLRDHIDSVYKVVHIGSFNVSLNALNLLYHVERTNQSNRFYTAFYKKLLDPQIGIAKKQAVFLNLLYRVLQNDQSLLRLYAFIKRILQITLYFPANMACATLYLISKVLQSRKDLKNFLLHSQNPIKIENNFSNAQENNSSKNKEIINIDENESMVPPEIDLNIMMNVTINTTENLPKQDIDVKEDIDADIKDIAQKPYDPFCRNPLYANAMKSLYAELVSLSKHFHPSVSLFANAIIQEKAINYTGDSLEDLTLIRFLDRYVFKNPKKLEDKKVQKKNDPLAQRGSYVPKGIRSLPVDSMAYLNEAEERIPVDELFLYHYLKRKSESTNIYNDKDSDSESVNSEEFNEMLDKFSTNKDLDDLDIAADIGTIKNKKDDEIDDLENSEYIEDEENDVNSNTELEADIDEKSDNSLDDVDDFDITDIEDEDLSDIYFSEDSDNNDDDDLSGTILNIKNKHIKGNDTIRQHKIKKNNKKNLDDIFVSAEKFSQMLEEQSRTKNKHGSTNALSTMDGATSKQIDWETKRNQKLTRSFDRKKRKRVKISNNKNSKKTKR